MTRRYPGEPPLLTERFRGAIEVDPERCWGCGACAAACPPNAIRVEVDGEGVRLYYFLGRCIFCGKCYEVCPRGAISVSRGFEYAAQSPEDLETVLVLEAARCPVCGRPFGSLRELRSVSEVAWSVKKRIAACPECRGAAFGSALTRGHARRG